MNLTKQALRANSEARADCGHGPPFFSQGREGEGDHRGERLRASLSAALFTGLQSDRAGALEGEGEPLRRAEARTRESLIGAMGLALSSVTAQDIKGYFGPCGYRSMGQLL